MRQRNNKTDFEAHWHKHCMPRISASKLAEAKSFLSPLYKKMKIALEPMRILDVGCGDGVHALALAEEGLGMHCYYGIDFSTNAIRLAQKRMQNKDLAKVEFQIGNALSLPYPSHYFDAVFSYGVMAYVGKPDVVLDEIMRVCKPGGFVGIWLYPKGLVGTMLTFTRALCRCLGRRLSKAVIYSIIPFLSVLPVRSGVNLFNSTWEQCAEVIEVNLLPKGLEFYSLEDVLDWFQKRCMTVQFIDQERPIAVWANIGE